MPAALLPEPKQLQADGGGMGPACANLQPLPLGPVGRCTPSSSNVTAWSEVDVNLNTDYSPREPSGGSAKPESRRAIVLMASSLCRSVLITTAKAASLQKTLI
ncbi:unnamed protein product [Symbiodinium sp. CCMP2592]|nr:unnamed protein product [Symbiodinium sp. CCMP2592]